MTWDIAVSAVAIIAGALVMLVSILRFRFILEKARYIQGIQRIALERYLKVHRALMIFFLLGYVVVLFGVVFQYAFLGNLLVGAIFFFGAVFVYTGLILKNRMLQEVMNQAEEDIKRREAERRAEASDIANRAKSRFLASMSHEIRTPMNAILGFAQLLQRDSDLTARQREYVEIINRSSEHLLQLVNDVLDMARIEEGQMTLFESEVDLPRMVADIERMFRERAAEKGLALNVDRADDVPGLVRVDEGKVRQVLINLLSNAMKFTDEGGIDMRVSVARGQGSQLRMVVEVQDTGCGIQPESLEQIFGAFQREGASSDKPGTGLGLSVSRQFAEFLGGILSVTSELGVGSVFRFEFEAQELSGEAQQQKRPQVVGLAPGAEVPMVLVVDDRPDNRSVLEHLLLSVGFKVCTAPSGQTALEAVATEWPDLALVDLRMPGMDGLELMEQMRRMDGGPDLPFIIVSASALEGEQDQVLGAGADGFLTKPVREDELFHAIGRYLGLTYVYADEAPSDQGTTDEFTLETGDLSGVPEDLVNGLRQAVLRGDIEQMKSHIDRIHQQDEKTGAALRRLADQFAYEALVQVLGE